MESTAFPVVTGFVTLGVGGVFCAGNEDEGERALVGSGEVERRGLGGRGGNLAKYKSSSTTRDGVLSSGTVSPVWFIGLFSTTLEERGGGVSPLGCSPVVFKSAATTSIACDEAVGVLVIGDGAGEIGLGGRGGRREKKASSKTSH